MQKHSIIPTALCRLFLKYLCNSSWGKPFKNASPAKVQSVFAKLADNELKDSFLMFCDRSISKTGRRGAGLSTPNIDLQKHSDYRRFTPFSFVKLLPCIILLRSPHRHPYYYPRRLPLAHIVLGNGGPTLEST